MNGKGSSNRSGEGSQFSQTVVLMMLVGAARKKVVVMVLMVGQRRGGRGRLPAVVQLSLMNQ